MVLWSQSAAEQYNLSKQGLVSQYQGFVTPPHIKGHFQFAFTMIIAGLLNNA